MFNIACFLFFVWKVVLEIVRKFSVLDRKISQVNKPLAKLFSLYPIEFLLLGRKSIGKSLTCILLKINKNKKQKSINTV